LLIAPDLQKLLVADRSDTVSIFDLRVQGQGPVASLPVVFPDELDYDPINQRAYVGSAPGPGSTAPPGTAFAVTVIDVANNKILGTIPMPDEMEQPRWNPNDGMIYQNFPVQSQLVVIDPQQGPVGTIVNKFPVPPNCANGLDLDPVTNTAMLVCSPGRLMIMDLKTGATVTTFPTAGGDVGLFNPHNRRYYVASSNAQALAGTTFSNCTKASDGNTYTIGVYSNFPTPNQLIGVTCSGRGHGVVGIDTMLNNIYQPTVQYPTNPSSPTTGFAGLLILHDPAPQASGVTSPGTQEAHVTASLSPLGGSGVTGTVDITLRRRNMNVDASLNGLPASSRSVWLVIETTQGHETVNCGVDSTGKGYCGGDLLGDPLIGAPVNVASGGIRAANGTLTLISTFPTFIPID
jgi:hypothetical protein